MSMYLVFSAEHLANKSTGLGAPKQTIDVGVEAQTENLSTVDLRTQTQNAAFFERKGPECKPWPRLSEGSF